MLISWLVLFTSIVNGGAAPAAAVPATAAFPQPSVPKQWQIDGIRLGDLANEVRESGETRGRSSPTNGAKNAKYGATRTGKTSVCATGKFLSFR